MELRFIGEGSEPEVLNGVPQAQRTAASGEVWPWRRWRGDPGVTDPLKFPNHPRNYIARKKLADAVNTALILEKPLLLTGNPGTGKSQLAERIAWELQLGPVLRFEAQSLSEAADLFYRFDVVGHLAAVEIFKARQQIPQSQLEKTREEFAPSGHAVTAGDLAAERFVKLGPLGEAIVRSDPATHATLFAAALAPEMAGVARRSVVLIDEIDKASRDFPNDLLNGIDRLEFHIRELRTLPLRAAEDLKPIVIITSNSERELPDAFLRRCAYIHIDDPTKDELRAIVYRRFFAAAGKEGDAPLPKSPKTIPPFYSDLLDEFYAFREKHGDLLQYTPGTSELIDWVQALHSQKVDQGGKLVENLDQVRRVAAAVAKNHDDAVRLGDFLDGLKPRLAG